MNEIGLYWPKIDSSDQWDERMYGALHDSTATFAYNAQEPSVSEPIQYGGVGIIATAEIKFRLQDRGRDPSGMGRWAWIRITGKEGHHTLFVTAYRPCQSGGAGSVYQQHARAMALNSDFRDPRTAILQDLVEAIETWKLNGDHVILGMDSNEDVRSGEVYQFLSQAGLREVILALHPDLSPPATHNRNQNREPIDGFWSTAGIEITKGGYLAFGLGCPSDHRVLWFEATYSVILGQRPSDLAPISPKRLKAKDPRLTKKYIQQVKTSMRTSGFLSRFDDLSLHSQLPWSKPSQVKYNHLQQENTALRKSIEKKLRTLYMGGVPWSPELQVL